MILLPILHLELSIDEGTKNVRETSDMAMWRETTENTKDTKILSPDEPDEPDKEIKPQNTQKCAEIDDGSREVQEKKFLYFFAFSVV